MIKKIIAIFGFLLSSVYLNAQYPPYPDGIDSVLIQVNVSTFDSLFLAPNVDCSDAITIVQNDTIQFENYVNTYTQTDSIFVEVIDSAYFDTCTVCLDTSFESVTSYTSSTLCSNQLQWFKLNFGEDDTLQLTGDYDNFYMYGPCNNLLQCCDGISQGFYQPSLHNSSSEITISDLNNQSGWYYVVVSGKHCSGDLFFGYETDQVYDTTYNSDSSYTFQANEGCEDCITSFNPRPGEKYVITAWTKEDGAAATKTSYDKPEIYMEYPSVSITQGAFTPSGAIIDGWQRIEGVFTIPPNTTDFKIILTSSSGDVYFDDVKIHPFDSSMKSFVYDPITKRLKATFDERHYATFYEYDKEGKLTRVKKETEKGIMTIKESRNNNSK